MNKKETKYVQKEFTKGSAAVLKYRESLREVTEHLEFLALGLREQASGKEGRLHLWNSAATVFAIKRARKLLDGLSHG